MKKSEFLFISKAVFLWTVLLLLVLFFSFKFVPLQKNFLGGGYYNYLSSPFLWVWANFDGEHYISIARDGYRPLTHFFFPLYPLMVRQVSLIFGKTILGYLISGLSVSWISFFLGVLGYYKLMRLDFNEKFSMKTLAILMLFPTSFYFVSVYTESLFFALSVWAFYFARKKMYTYAALVGMFLTATRLVGVIIVPALVAEWFISNKKKTLTSFPWIYLFSIVGLLGYMYFLDRTTGDMFAFFNNITLFGQQRSSHLVSLPQVFYRYIFKIIPSLQTGYFPSFFTPLLEFSVAALFLLLSLLSFIKVRLSYSIFLFLGYLIPTFSGSFSSLPRYVLVLFPAYILLTRILEGKRFATFVFVGISAILLVVSFALFARGYFIS